jgi:hypothetical protein
MDFVLTRELGDGLLFFEQLEHDLRLKGGCVSGFHSGSLQDPWTGRCPNSLGHYSCGWVCICSILPCDRIVRAEAARVGALVAAANGGHAP